jgi:GrpB-like predicted nucleotidyltransferase (UPF0157 family)
MLTAQEITRYAEADPTENPWIAGAPPVEELTIVPADATWPAVFAELARSLRDALGAAALDIAHVGSTAVSGLAAKPVIDIDLTVVDPANEDAYVPLVESLGYRLTVREPSWYEHRCFRLADPRVNLHVFGPDSAELVRHRMFRDWLRANPADRDLYEAAKRAAIIGGGPVTAYNARKQTVIRDIYRRLFIAAGLLPDH